ncbi:MAG: hypothetical protein JWP38_739 [Herbaspirillum sp.]|nr:hypothetical protein [Herbaspirillum sp.]
MQIHSKLARVCAAMLLLAGMTLSTAQAADADAGADADADAGTHKYTCEISKGGLHGISHVEANSNAEAVQLAMLDAARRFGGKPADYSAKCFRHPQR